jgi:hypothetical protein
MAGCHCEAHLQHCQILEVAAAPGPETESCSLVCSRKAASKAVKLRERQRKQEAATAAAEHRKPGTWRSAFPQRLTRDFRCGICPLHCALTKMMRSADVQQPV